MELVEVNCLPYFLHLGKYPAAFQRQRYLGRNELAEALDGGKVQLAVSLIENKKSCGISFENIGQKIYQRLIGVGIHRSPRFLRLPGGSIFVQGRR